MVSDEYEITLENGEIRLNPCCNGIWSQTEWLKSQESKSYQSLNPCCDGIWSRTEEIQVVKTNVWKS